MKISVGVSSHHVHLKEEDLKTLFGNDYNLSKLRDLKQPGEFASTETVTLKTEKGIIKNVRILGPCRKYTQVEISKTDAYLLGIDPPVRKSGDILSSSPITIIGPSGVVALKEGCIISERHIHLTEKHLKEYNLENKDHVNVLIPGSKGGILFNVKLKVSRDAYFELHLDTDCANAFSLKNGDIVDIIEE